MHAVHFIVLHRMSLVEKKNQAHPQLRDIPN